jgi:urease accessory protein UreF
MRRVILAGTVATSLLTGAAAGLMLGVPVTAHSGERLASTTPTVSIAAAATAAAAGAVPAIAAPVQTAATSAPIAPPAIAPLASALQNVSTGSPTGSTPNSVNSKVAPTAIPTGTGGELSVVASALHMALSNLKAALADGESLAQVATSAGVDPAKLSATLVQDATSKIDAAVALGKLAQAQADKVLAMLPGLVTDVMNHTFSDIGQGFEAGSKLPESLGSLGDLASLGNFANLADPGKLASLANMGDLPKLGDMGSAANFTSFFSNMFGSFGNGSAGTGSQAGTGGTVDPQTLISDLVSMATASVNAALSAGLLTPTQANTILTSLTPTITDLVHKILDTGVNLGNQAAGWASFASSWMGHHH